MVLPQFHGAPLNGVPVNGAPLNGTPFHGAPSLGLCRSAGTPRQEEEERARAPRAVHHEVRRDGRHVLDERVADLVGVRLFIASDVALMLFFKNLYFSIAPEVFFNALYSILSTQ